MNSHYNLKWSHIKSQIYKEYFRIACFGWYILLQTNLKIKINNRQYSMYVCLCTYIRSNTLEVSLGSHDLRYQDPRNKENVLI